MKTLFLIVSITTTVLLMVACGLYQSKVQKLQVINVELSKALYNSSLQLTRDEAALHQSLEDMDCANEVLHMASAQLNKCALILSQR